jgi:hypothetical protein
MKPMIPILLAMFVLAPRAGVLAADTVVFSTDFESGLPAEFTATGAAIEGVQGYAGLGPVGNQFGGSFLRYTSVPLHDTQLTLTNLPPHDHLRLDFLLAVIDSWDGTELLKVSIDGVEVFSHWFQLATGDASSYVAPAGGLLSSGVNLGFSNGPYYFRDRAYDMSVDTVFTVPHSAGSVTINWYLGAVSGPAASQWQGGNDESWALDNVKVVVSSTATGVGPTPGLPAALTLLPAAPNPFSSVTTLRAGTPAASDARLEVFDVTGRRVVFRDLPLGAGWQDVVFDGRDDAGRALASGVYFARVRAAGVTRAQKFVITR